MGRGRGGVASLITDYLLDIFTPDNPIDISVVLNQVELCIIDQMSTQL